MLLYCFVFNFATSRSPVVRGPWSAHLLRGFGTQARGLGRSLGWGGEPGYGSGFFRRLASAIQARIPLLGWTTVAGQAAAGKGMLPSLPACLCPCKNGMRRCRSRWHHPGRVLRKPRHRTRALESLHVVACRCADVSRRRVGVA